MRRRALTTNHLHQMTEEDLAEIERILPQLSDALLPVMNNRIRVKLRRCQSILSNVRWNYGPPSEVEVVSGETEPPA